MKHNFYLLVIIFSAFVSCSVQKQISRSAIGIVLNDSSLKSAHVGISIFDPSENKYLYNYQGGKYFIPASNIKIPTCYAAMKYLGDSLVGLKYINSGETLTIIPSGDPTFLLPEFKNQPLLEFFQRNTNDISISLHPWQENPLGSGWSWNDYQETYMAERSIMPVYGNVIQFSGTIDNLSIIPSGAADSLFIVTGAGSRFIKNIVREKNGNVFRVYRDGSPTARIIKTIDTKNGRMLKRLLEDTLKRTVNLSENPSPVHFNNPGIRSIKTQPTDSLLMPMMHRSDNFFAEQSLLMVSNEILGIMDDSKVIDSILETDFKNLPQKPRWVDGSGLSRYNLFTPMSLVAILKKMKDEFGMDRIKTIFPTGGEGTISSYYKKESGFIYGKTGTLSGVVAFSGFLYTRKGKLLIFSTLINNHQASATDIRRAIEKFLIKVRSLD